MADNAHVTQLQAHDTRHRRMQEVNSLCTDSRLLPDKYCIEWYWYMEFNVWSGAVSVERWHW